MPTSSFPPQAFVRGVGPRAAGVRPDAAHTRRGLRGPPGPGAGQGRNRETTQDWAEVGPEPAPRPGAEPGLDSAESPHPAATAGTPTWGSPCSCLDPLPPTTRGTGRLAETHNLAGLASRPLGGVPAAAPLATFQLGCFTRFTRASEGAALVAAEAAAATQALPGIYIQDR